jgi:hypothetical protein
MIYEFMLKAFGRAAFITFILIIIGAALWYYTILAIIILILGWLTLMFYTDPPENWG